MRSWFVNQSSDPEGQRQGQRSCYPLEYEQTSSTGIKERRQRKTLSLSGRQNSYSAFHNSVSVQTLRLNFHQMVLTDRGAPSEDIYPLTHGPFFLQWDWVIVSLSSITALNPHKWKWPLPCVMLRVWQNAWVWPFSVQSSFAVCPKKIIVSNLNLHPNMPWPQETLMWECGSGPSMAVSLKSGFKEPRLYHCSFRICQTVHSVGITWYHIPQGSLFVYDSWGRRRRMQIIFWTHTKKTYQSSSGTTKLLHCQKNRLSLKAATMFTSSELPEQVHWNGDKLWHSTPCSQEHCAVGL